MTHGLERAQVVRLNEEQRHLVVFCLQLSAEKFTEHANSLRPDIQYSRMTEQFDRQTAEALELIARIEQAEYVELGKVEE